MKIDLIKINNEEKPDSILKEIMTKITADASNFKCHKNDYCVAVGINLYQLYKEIKHQELPETDTFLDYLFGIDGFLGYEITDDFIRTKHFSPSQRFVYLFPGQLKVGHYGHTLRQIINCIKLGLPNIKTKERPSFSKCAEALGIEEKDYKNYIMTNEWGCAMYPVNIPTLMSVLNFFGFPSYFGYVYDSPRLDPDNPSILRSARGKILCTNFKYKPKQKN